MSKTCNSDGRPCSFPQCSPCDGQDGAMFSVKPEFEAPPAKEAVLIEKKLLTNLSESLQPFIGIARLDDNGLTFEQLVKRLGSLRQYANACMEPLKKVEAVVSPAMAHYLSAVSINVGGPRDDTYPPGSPPSLASRLTEFQKERHHMKETSPQGVTVMKVTSLVVSWPKKYLLLVQPCLDQNMTALAAAEWMREKSREVQKEDPEFSWNLWWVALGLDGCGFFRFVELESGKTVATKNEPAAPKPHEPEKIPDLWLAFGKIAHRFDADAQLSRESSMRAKCGKTFRNDEMLNAAGYTRCPKCTAA